MALQKGDAACTTGLSKRIYDARWADKDAIGLNAAGQAALKADCYAIACAVVDEIQANASVTATVNPLGLTAPNGPVTGTASATGQVN